MQNNDGGPPNNEEFDRDPEHNLDDEPYYEPPRSSNFMVSIC
jgi:hypothetical protein